MLQPGTSSIKRRGGPALCTSTAAALLLSTKAECGWRHGRMCWRFDVAEGCGDDG